jgi:hypothetical protein
MLQYGAAGTDMYEAGAQINTKSNQDGGENKNSV